MGDYTRDDYWATSGQSYTAEEAEALGAFTEDAMDLEEAVASVDDEEVS